MFVYLKNKKFIQGECNKVWLCNIIRKNVTKSLSDLVGTIHTDNQAVHEAVLKLFRSASAIEEIHQADQSDSSTAESWTSFIQLIVSNLCFGEQQQQRSLQKLPQQQQQQHFYNLGKKRQLRKHEIRYIIF